MSTTGPKKSIIKKVKEQTVQESQLVTFIKSLGIDESPTVYMQETTAYIGIETILPILSVPLTWFMKNSEPPIHYIVVSNKVYVNKYGLTKLLAQSKEAVAFRLQDYLYELLYTVETKGSVSKDEVKSREALVQAYELSIASAENTLTEFREANDILRCDYASMELENQRMKDALETVELDLSETRKEYENMKTIANKLARLVRIKSKKPPTEAFDESLDIIEEEECTSDIEEDAATAKEQLKKPTKAPTKKKTVSTVREYFLYQSEQRPDDSYIWTLSDHELTDPLLTEYMRLSLSDEKRKAICLFLSMQDSYPEYIINKLIL
jgi:hypothetical protein